MGKIGGSRPAAWTRPSTAKPTTRSTSGAATSKRPSTRGSAPAAACGASISPTAKASGGHMRTSSRPVSGSRSRRNRFIPSTALAPPDSKAVRSASGLVAKQFVGARASPTCRAANSSRLRLDSSRPGTRPGSAVQALALTRYACFSTSSHGMSSQARSRKRRSSSSGRATGSASAPAMRAAPYAHSPAHDRARSSHVAARGDGSAARPVRSCRMASFRRSGSSNASGPGEPGFGAARDSDSASVPSGGRDVVRGSSGERSVAAKSWLMRAPESDCAPHNIVSGSLARNVESCRPLTLAARRPYLRAHRITSRATRRCPCRSLPRESITGSD